MIGAVLYKVGSRLHSSVSLADDLSLQRFMGVVFSPVGASPIINRLHKVLTLMFSTIVGWLILGVACVGVLCVTTAVHVLHRHRDGNLDRPCLPWCLPGIGCMCGTLSGRFRCRCRCEYQRRGLIASILTLRLVQGNNSVAFYSERCEPLLTSWWLNRHRFQGYLSIRRELPRVFIAFAVLHVLMLGLWPSMFGTSMYAYAFNAWPFFACVSVVSCGFLIATTVAAIACRFNFGKGLSNFRKYLPSILLLHSLTTRVTSGRAGCPLPGWLYADALLERRSG